MSGLIGSPNSHETRDDKIEFTSVHNFYNRSILGHHNVKEISTFVLTQCSLIKENSCSLL